jgi:hypothetical protein
MNTKNKTKGLLILAIIAFAATFISGCIPSGYGDINPNLPNNDTTVSYYKPNKLILYYKDIDAKEFYDFDKDGIYDYEFYAYGSPDGGRDFTYIKGLGGSEVILKSSSNNSDYKFFKVGDPINTNNYVTTTAYLGESGVKLANIPYIHTDIIGFRIKKGNVFYYGWMQLKRTITYSDQIIILGFQFATSIKIELLSYAIKKQSDITIQAGKY